MNPKPYNPDSHPLIAKWCARRGADLTKISRELRIPKKQLRQWITDHPELQTAIDEGHDAADARVMDALYRRAIGVTVTQTEAMREGNKERVKKITRQLPPHVQAAIFWLKNRRPDTWRMKQPPPPPEKLIIRFRPPWGGEVRPPDPPKAA